MNASFNLITEAWIPVVNREGRCQEVGLRQALGEAETFRGVAAPTALETASILRLLLAVLHRTHDTSSKQAWETLWKKGQFEGEMLERYWERWVERFDLFHPEHPFYQQPTNRKKPTSTASFYPGLAASDHFHHSVQVGERALTPAEATRNVLVAQAFGLSGGCLPVEKLSHKASPWVAGLVFFVEGETLFQTLMCNLLRYDEYSPTPDLHQTEEDRPNWEADDPYQPRAQALGYLDYLTWPSRRVWLMPEMGAGGTVVRQYVDFVGTAPPAVLDPFKFYRRDEKSKNATGYVALYLNPNKATWRNSAVILRLYQSGMRPPEALNWLASLRREGAIQSPRTHLAAYGMVVENQTKVNLMRQETMPLPLDYLEQTTDLEEREDLLAALDRSMRQAELVGSALSAAIFEMARTLYPSPKGGEKAEQKKQLSAEQRQQIDRIANSITTKAEFWAALERPFYQLVLDLPGAVDARAVHGRWLEEVLAAGRAALASSEARAGQYPKALKAGVMARGLFEGFLRKNGLSTREREGARNAEASV